VAEGGWVKWVEPSTRVDAWLVDVFATDWQISAEPRERVSVLRNSYAKQLVALLEREGRNGPVLGARTRALDRSRCLRAALTRFDRHANRGLRAKP
jgi:hypothetical protein